MKDLGEKLKSLRKEYGMTLQTLSNITGISKSHISRMENGEANFNPNKVSAILIALNSPKEIYDKIMSSIIDNSEEQINFSEVAATKTEAETKEIETKDVELDVHLAPPHVTISRCDFDTVNNKLIEDFKKLETAFNVIYADYQKVVDDNVELQNTVNKLYKANYELSKKMDKILNVISEELK